MQSWFAVLFLAMAMLLGLSHSARAAEIYMPLVNAPSVEEAPPPAPIVLQDGVYEFDNGDNAEIPTSIYFEVANGGATASFAYWLVDRGSDNAFCNPLGIAYSGTAPISYEPLGKFSFVDTASQGWQQWLLACNATSSTTLSCKTDYWNFSYVGTARDGCGDSDVVVARRAD